MEEWEDDAAETLDRLTNSTMADAFRGTVTILSLSAPSGRGRYQSCTMDLLLEAPGLETETTSTVAVLDRRSWPDVGTVLRARISRKRPRMLEVDWDMLAR